MFSFAVKLRRRFGRAGRYPKRWLCVDLQRQVLQWRQKLLLHLSVGALWNFPRAILGMWIRNDQFWADLVRHSHVSLLQYLRHLRPEMCGDLPQLLLGSFVWNMRTLFQQNTGRQIRIKKFYPSAHWSRSRCDCYAQWIKNYIHRACKWGVVPSWLPLIMFWLEGDLLIFCCFGFLCVSFIKCINICFVRTRWKLVQMLFVYLYLH